MTAPTLERSQQHDQAWEEAMGLALLWAIPVIGFLVVLLGLV
ncbi:hypothetical protein [Nocardioides dongkuii]|nr:hypothetical protein [Nocardioides dongkuii]